MARSKRFTPFGGNKRTALRNQELRDHKNQLHALQQESLKLAERNQELNRRVQDLDRQVKPPMAALDRVVAIPVRAAIELQIVDPIADIHRWMGEVRVASGNPQERG